MKSVIEIACIGFACFLTGFAVAFLLGRAIHQADERQRESEAEGLRAIGIGGASDVHFFNHNRGDTRD